MGNQLDLEKCYASSFVFFLFRRRGRGGLIGVGLVAVQPAVVWSLLCWFL